MSLYNEKDSRAKIISFVSESYLEYLWWESYQRTDK